MYPSMSLPEELRSLYYKQKYRFVGNHSAVKTCHWLSRSLNTKGKENCYKNKFYGIPTHRCLQMTPSLGHCTQSCLFCWRATPETIGVSWEQTQSIESPENPDKIIDGCIEQHRKLIYGFGGNKKVSKNMLKEAMNPMHAAISLEGEPTLYPYLGELVQAYIDRGFKSVFIVTNGTKPEVLSNLSCEPSQLYVSLCAPDEDTYKKTCRPMISNAWEKVLESVELLDSFNCPTVLRHTLVPKLNMHSPEKYGRLAELGNVTYMEPKGAMSVGAARDRFRYDEMAWFEDVYDFACEIADACSYKIIDEHRFSNIVLLSTLDKPLQLY
jgi:tRNA wybutosine-synthesizing protein 1